MTRTSNRWEKSVGDLSYNSIRNYRQAVKIYEDFHGVSMDFLINEALDEQTQRVPQHELKLYDRLIDFRNHLIAEGRIANGVRTYMSRIKALYKKNRVTIPYIPPMNQINVNRNEVIRFEDYLTKDELRKGIEYLPLIQQARMMAMVSGGLSNDECSNLKTKEHFIDPLYHYHQCDDDIDALEWLAKSDNVIWIVCIKRGKTGKPFYAIMNPECVTLTARAKLEEVKPLRYGRTPRKVNDKLYTTEKNYFGQSCRRINDGLGFGYVGAKEAFATTNESGFITIPKLHFTNFRPQGFDRKDYDFIKKGDNIEVHFHIPHTKIIYNHGGKSRFRPHMFRKFHATSVHGNYHITDEGLSPIEVDELQGRGMTSVQETYIKANPKKQKLLYCRIINNVSLWHEYDFRVVDDDIELVVINRQEENEKLKKENEKLREKLEVSQDIREDIKSLVEDKGIDEVVDIVSKLLKGE